MIYGKKQAVMTRGFASLTMVCLHLFCRLGNDILYTPLIWINSEKPFVYWIGFFCEICVPIYSMCAGYAQHIIYEKGNASIKQNCKRILKLLENYWIILCLACLIGLFMGNPRIPKDFGSFVKNVFLVGRYNPSWWYINAYCLVLLVPQKLFMKPVKRINAYVGIAGCLAILVIWYLLTRFEIVQFESRYEALNFVVETAKDLMKVVPYYFIGAFMHKENIFDKADTYLSRIKNIKSRNALLLAISGVLFIVVNILEKAVLMGALSILIMLIFNLIKMPKAFENIFFFFRQALHKYLADSYVALCCAVLRLYLDCKIPVTDFTVNACVVYRCILYCYVYSKRNRLVNKYFEKEIATKL